MNIHFRGNEETCIIIRRSQKKAVIWQICVKQSEVFLHFENGIGIASSHDCSNQLKRYLPRYDKGIDIRKITLCMIQVAIRRAKNVTGDWPRDLGSTTVYRLVENILVVEQ
jgi:hypothetical protein